MRGATDYKRNFSGMAWALIGVTVLGTLFFLGLNRTIGWDIAITADFPRLIEGNVTWDTLIGETRMGSIYQQLLGA